MPELSLETPESKQVDLSIIIPTYRETSKLRNVLHSFRHASSGLPITFEVILVDNNSPNPIDILGIAQEHSDQLNIVFVEQPRLKSTFSLCSARNRGVLNSRGSVVFFTDSDCMIDRNLLRTVFDLISQDKIGQDIFTGERLFVHTNQNLYQSQNFHHDLLNLKRVPSASNYGLVKDRRFPWITNLPDQEHPWNFVHGCFLLMSKQLYVGVGGSDTSFDGHWGYEEIDLVYRTVQKFGSKVRYLEDAKVYHQEFDEDLEKISENDARTNKSNNPNYLRVCARIPGYDEFKVKQWQTLKVGTN